MWVMDVLFYHFLQLKIYRSLYWSVMFLIIIQLIMLLPLAIILLRVNYGCEGLEKMDSSIKGIIAIFCIAFLGLNFRYYSSSRVRKLRQKFANQSKSLIWIKTVLATLLFLTSIILSDDILGMFMEIPEC